MRDKVIYKSQVKENNHHPVWNEDFKFLVHEPQYQVCFGSRFWGETLGMNH